MERRDFIKTSAATGVLLSTNMLANCNISNKRLKVLVLGGTSFVGPAIVESALKNNHKVTLFNRGITNPKLFPNLRLLKGDRENGTKDYEVLSKEKWDVVIDVWPEKSELVHDATSSLINNTKHYIFISSIAVYDNFQEVGLNEDSNVVSRNLSRDKWSYSEEKLAAENIVIDRFPKNHTILRCGAIKGWRDPALDLMYWSIKLNRDKSIIAPGSGKDPLQFIDVNDVGKFATLAAENSFSGIFNCAGPMELLTWKGFLDSAKNHYESTTELVWASEEFLSINNVSSFSDLPLWAPLSEDRGFMQISNKKLIETGFQLKTYDT